MITFVGILTMVGLISWGLYLFYKVHELDKKIARWRQLSAQSADDR